MEMHNVDMNLSQEILDNFNAGTYDHYEPIRAGGIPGIDNRTILDMNAEGWSLDAETVLKRAETFNIPKEMMKPETRCKDTLFLSATDLASIGRFLFPLLSPGVLNGGSATSYLDRKKNRSFNEDLY
ncbi:MAG: hypothetical protein JW760_06685, partial [Spirochaetales bacterium]|nr:hypothetical protein [Spirochaetales bacterium]